MQLEDIFIWLSEEYNRQLFRPTNKRPTPDQVEAVFKIANYLDSTQTHKKSSCSRCYYNALRAIEKALNIY